MKNNMPDNQISKNDRILASISYLWIFCLIPMFFNRNDSEFVRFHAKQGLVLLFSWLVVSLLAWFPILGPLAVLALLIFSILGFLRAIQGEEWEIPWIGRYARQIKI